MYPSFRPRRLLTCLGLLGVVIAARLAAAPAALATISVIVERADGTFVTGLTGGDFVVTSDGIRQPIESVKRTDAPLTLVLLLDTSTSVGFKWSDGTIKPFTWDDFMRAVERPLLGALQPGDRLRVASLADTVVLSPRFTGSRDELSRALAEAMRRDMGERVGPSPIWDGTAEALTLMADESGHRAVVLFTDGEATGNRRTLAEVTAEANRLGIAVHVVSVAVDALYAAPWSGSSSGLLQRPTRGLRYLADVTGGVFLPADYGPARRDLGDKVRPEEAESWVRVDRQNQINPWRADHPDEAFTRVLAALRASYSVSFNAGAADGRSHALDVHVTRPGLTARAPKSYVVR